MQNFFKYVLFFLVMLSSLGASGSSSLLKLYSDYDRDIYDVFLTFKDAQLNGIELFNEVNGEKISHSLNDLKKGIVLKKVQEKNVLILRADHFDPTTGGLFVIDYLHNALINQRRIMEFNVSVGNGEGELFYQGLNVTSLMVKVNKTAVGVIGIKNIVVN